jgi:ABC-type nickel/cobalt efflux system permease component RcnA
VRFVAAPGANGGGASAAAASPATATSDALAALVAERELTPAGMGAALLLALLLGAGHALAPGHGKTIVGAYLVGSRGTALHAVVLGLVTTATHTAGVFALGFVTLTLSHYVLPEQLYPWLELLSGALVAVIGVGLLLSRIAGLLHRRRADAAHAPDHHHGPGGHSTGVVGAPLHHHGPGGHTHDHGEALADELAGRLGGSATSPRRTSWRGLVALGVSGGLLPCPSALVVLLGAIALGRVGFGMLLIVAFSLGLAAVLTGIGLLLVYARGLIERVPTDSRILRAMPLASAAAVIIAGVGITAAALGQL